MDALSQDPLSLLAETPAKPLTLDGSITINNPNNLTEWIIASYNAPQNQKAPILLDSLSYALQISPDYKDLFIRGVLRIVVEDFGGIGPFIQQLLETNQPELNKKIATLFQDQSIFKELHENAKELLRHIIQQLKSQPAEHEKVEDKEVKQTPVEVLRVTVPIPETLPEMPVMEPQSQPEPLSRTIEEKLWRISRAKEEVETDADFEAEENVKKEPEDFSLEEVTAFQSFVENFIQTLKQSGDQELSNGVRNIAQLLRMNTEQRPRLYQLQLETAKKLADSVTEICNETVGEFDPQHGDSFLVDCSVELTAALEHALPFLLQPEKNILTQAVNEHLDKIKKHFIFKTRRYEAMVRFAASLSEEGKQKATTFYVELMQTKFNQSLYSVGDLFTMFDDEDVRPTDTQMGREAIQKVIFNNNPDTYVDLATLLDCYQYTGSSNSGDSSDPDYSFRLVLRHNLESIQKLEKISPGATKYLLEQRGVKHFDRYPLELLTQQYQERDAIPKNGYITILYPETDHNQAFSGQPLFAALLKQANDLGIGIRLAEAGSGKEILGRLNQLTRKYGKSSGGFFGAHGSPEMMDWGDEQDGTVNITTLAKSERLTRKAFQKFFTRGSTLILSSCSTGTDEGFASKLAALGMRVIAPEKSIASEKYLVSRKNQKIEIDIKYTEDVKRVFEAQRQWPAAIRRILAGFRL